MFGNQSLKNMNSWNDANSFYDWVRGADVERHRRVVIVAAVLVVSGCGQSPGKAHVEVILMDRTNHHGFQRFLPGGGPQYSRTSQSEFAIRESMAKT